MTEQEPRPTYEKEEKGREMEEKADEKQREKMDEKRWDEKWRRDPLSATIWALLLIWAGTAFLAWNLGFLESLNLPGDFGPWSLVFAGAGALLLIEALVRIAVPAYSGPVVGSIILGMVFLGIALGDVVGWNMIWPLIIIGLGLAFLVSGILRRR